ncbi:MAG: lamin tail domain-containing protein [Candidatus Aenigmarchaeota archaeon]|nr:lamin tail domain-containing protein [Candidatus Aenigmarchaeota archaeon]
MYSVKFFFSAFFGLFLMFGVVSADVVINEVELNPEGQYDTDEWVELYNTNAYESVNISGYSIVDRGGDRDVIPDGTFIGPNDFFVFTENISSLGLVNVNESIFLYDSDDLLIDEILQISDESNDVVTLQRSPDGSDNWKLCEGTPGKSNDCDGGEIPEFPMFIMPVFVMFAALSVARKFAPHGL